MIECSSCGGTKICQLSRSVSCAHVGTMVRYKLQCQTCKKEWDYFVSGKHDHGRIDYTPDTRDGHTPYEDFSE